MRPHGASSGWPRSFAGKVWRISHHRPLSTPDVSPHFLLPSNRTSRACRPVSKFSQTRSLERAREEFRSAGSCSLSSRRGLSRQRVRSPGTRPTTAVSRCAEAAWSDPRELPTTTTAHWTGVPIFIGCSDMDPHIPASTSTRWPRSLRGWTLTRRSGSTKELTRGQRGRTRIRFRDGC